MARNQLNMCQVEMEWREGPGLGGKDQGMEKKDQQTN